MVPIANLHLADVMDRHIFTVSAESTIADMVERMKFRHVTHVVVVAAQRPIGIFTERDLVRLLHGKVDRSLAVAELMSKPVTTVPGGLGFRSAYIQLCLARLRHLVVIDESGAVTGVAAERDFLGHLGMELFQNVRSLRDLIDRQTPLLAPDLPVNEAIDLMVREKRGCVLIGQDRLFLGIFTEDQIPTVLARHEDGSPVPLHEVMRSTIQPVTEAVSLAEVMAQLVRERISYVVVVDADDHIVGTIAQTHLLENVRTAVYAEMATRQLVEDQLLQVEAQLEATLEQTPNVAVQWYDKEGCIRYWNHASEMLYGYSAVEAMGKTLDQLILTPTQAHEFKVLLDKVARDGKTFGPKEYRIRNRRGETRWVEATLFPIPGEIQGETFLVSMDVDVSRRKRSELALRESEGRLQQVLEATQDAIWDYDVGTGLVTHNLRWCEMLGLPDTMIQHPVQDFFDLVHPADLPRTRAAIEASVNNDSYYTAEFRIRHAEGHYLWGHDRGHVVGRDEEGKPTRMVGAIVDITQRKFAEQSLKESEARFRQLFESSPDAVFIMEGNTFVDANLGAARMFAKESGEAFRKLGPADVSPPCQADGELSTKKSEHLLELAKITGIQRFEWVYQRSDGTAFDAEVTLSAIRLGDVQAFYSIVRDITENKRIERELAAYRKDLEKQIDSRTAELVAIHSKLAETQFAMEKAGIGIHWVDAHSGQFIYVNSYAAESLGYTAEKMATFRISELDPNFPPGDFAEITSKLFAGGKAHFESALRARDGRLVPVDVVGYRFQGDKGSAGHIITFVTDISERKANERALLEAKEAAEAATRAKSAFLANMSHEIRTPLSAITGMTHLMRRDGVNKEQEERLEKIDTAGQHLLEIINAILDLSKIEAGKFVLEEAPVNIGNILNSVAAILAERAGGKHLSLLVETFSPPCPILGDATRIQQALLNYAGNAIKFTNRGRVVLRSKVERESKDKVWIRFEVEDTGIGIDPDVIKRLFGAFEQADNSTTRQYGGTGLGLAITKKLAELMGGTVGVQSELGQGSTFWFSGCFRKGETHAMPSAPPSESAELTLLRQHAGKRVLLVEDEEVNQEIALLLLEDTGLIATLARNGEEALQIARRESFDLVLMDMQMPVMDGLEATRRLRLLPAYADIPIIAMTANAYAEDRQRCLAAGMNDFIAKPFMPETVFEQILWALSPPSKRQGRQRLG